MGVLMVVTGIVASVVGVALGRHRLRVAHRAHARTASLSASAPEGWDWWFLGGFSGMTVGLHWVYAIVAWFAWSLAGLWFVWFGLRLLSRA